LLALTPGGEGIALERGRKRPGQPQQRAEHVDADRVVLQTSDPQVMTILVSRRGDEPLPTHASLQGARRGQTLSARGLHQVSRQSSRQCVLGMSSARAADDAQMNV
jgi:hypothetical protein